MFFLRPFVGNVIIQQVSLLDWPFVFGAVAFVLAFAVSLSMLISHAICNGAPISIESVPIYPSVYCFIEKQKRPMENTKKVFISAHSSSFDFASIFVF